MSSVETTLPSSSGVFERALAAGMSDDLPIPFAQVMDPDTTPAPFLPFLASHRSVDLWYDDWSELRQRQMICEAPDLAELKGTHEGVVRFLGFVDAEVVDFVSYPARFVMGLSSPSYTPIGHPPFKARWLVKVLLDKPVNAFVLGLSALGRGALRKIDLTPVRRAKEAMRVAKAPETEYLITTAWRRQITFADEILIADGHPVGGYIDRTHL